MAKENEILEFEDLLKDVHNKKKINNNDPRDRANFLTVILIYFLIAFIFSIVLSSIFSGIDSLNETYSENELIMLNVSRNVDSIATLEINDYQALIVKYQDKIVQVGDYDGYMFFVNSENDYYDELLLTEFEGNIVLNEANLLMIFSFKREISVWNEDGRSITIYAGENQVLPAMFQAPYEVIDGPKIFLTPFAASLNLFLSQIALIPPIFYLLKKNIKDDFNSFKSRKKEWIVLIIVGYLYVILGTIFSKLLSNFFSNLLNFPISEPLNQQTITALLNSNGVVMMLISTVIFAPIIEELVFRKAIFGVCKKDSTGLIVSSFTFGAIHLLNEPSILSALVNGPAYFIMGAIFGYIYLKNDKNIMAPILIHFVTNLFGVLGVLFLL